MWFSKRLRVRFSLILSLVIFLSILIYFHPFDFLNEKFLDFFYQVKPVETDIVVVGIDHLAQQTVGPWPWPAQKHVQLLEKIQEQEPVVVLSTMMSDASVEDQVLYEKLASNRQIILASENDFWSGSKGHSQFKISFDDKVRKISADDGQYPALAVLAAELADSHYEDPELYINYRFSSGLIPTISAQDVLADRNLHKLKDSIVLLGLTGEKEVLLDTPLGIMNPVIIQANAIDTINSYRGLTALPVAQELLVGVVLALVPIILFEFGNFKRMFTTSSFLLVAICVIAFVVFRWFYIITPLAYWLLAIILGVFTALVIRWQVKNLDNLFLKRAFSQYVSADVMGELIKSPSKLSLQGKKAFLTVMFIDLCGFTSYAEDKDPKKVMKKLNQILQIVSDIIIKRKGTIDKYLGDGVLAFWGAPFEDKFQASHACQAALDIKQQVEAATEFKVSVGLNFGEVIVGNVGSDNRFDYTVIGDVVNTASRIEAATRDLKKDVVASDEVVERVKEESGLIEFKALKTIKVKGKKKGVKVWEVAGKVDGVE